LRSGKTEGQPTSSIRLLLFNLAFDAELTPKIEGRVERQLFAFRQHHFAAAVFESAGDQQSPRH